MLLRRLLRLVRGVRFQDYEVQTGYTNVGNNPVASIEEFFALVGTGESPEEALSDLQERFYERIAHLRNTGETIPLPGSGKGRAKFAANDQVASLGAFVDRFWSEILDTSYATSFVSDESTLSAWEQCVPGGREEIVQRVCATYGVDISEYYDEPVPEVLRRLQDGARKAADA